MPRDKYVWYSAGLAIEWSLVQISPAATVYQHQLSTPSLRGRLMSTVKSWGVNGHTTLCTSPHICGLVASAGVWLRATGNRR